LAQRVTTSRITDARSSLVAFMVAGGLGMEGQKMGSIGMWWAAGRCVDGVGAWRFVDREEWPE
jgi:hypothetical protein